MSKEAMKLALEALQKIYIAPEHEEYIRVWWPACEQAITALREALAEQPAQQCRTDGRCQYAIDSGAEGMGHCPPGKCCMPAQQALDKKAENARELGLDYELPITMQEGEFDCTHAERLCAELKAAHPVTPCTHPSLGACSLREDGTASRWNCVMCGTEFVPKATNRWAEFNEATKRNMEHAEWYLSTHPQTAQQAPVAWRYLTQYKNQSVWTYCAFEPTSREKWEALYTSPPAQRTWVGLTDAERKLVRDSVGYNQFVTAGEYAEHVQNATEFKLMEKNI